MYKLSNYFRRIAHNHLELEDTKIKDVIIIEDIEIQNSIPWWYEAKIMNKIYLWWNVFRDIKRQRLILTKE